MLVIPGWIGSNVFCMTLLIYILWIKRKTLSKEKDLRVFEQLVLYIILAMFFDTISRLYQYKALTENDVVYKIIVFSTYVKYAILPVIVPLFLEYYSLQILDESPKGLKRAIKILWIIEFFYTLAVISSKFTNFVFYYDVNRVYHRGHFYHLMVAMPLFMGIFAQINVLKYEHLILDSNYKFLKSFLPVPIILSILQSLLYGLSLGLMGFVFSSLVVFINMVNINVNIDYLTGLSNRKVFDAYLNKFITDDSCKPFSVLLIDVDDFKSINDSLGHGIGDEALSNVSKILMKSLRKNDIISRYGGDEFSALLVKCNEENLKNVLDRIESNVKEFNKNDKVKYILSLSIGASVYKEEIGDSPKDFLKYVDDLMYKNKKENKKTFSGSLKTDVI